MSDKIDTNGDGAEAPFYQERQGLEVFIEGSIRSVPAAPARTPRSAPEPTVPLGPRPTPFRLGPK